MAQALGRVQEVSKSLDKLHFINGGKLASVSSSSCIQLTLVAETGWPGTGGTNAGAAIAGDDNMKTYWQSAMCGLLDWGVDIFWFEAFDEPNKPDSTGENGQVSSEQHWGAFSSSRVAKFALHC